MINLTGLTDEQLDAVIEDRWARAEDLYNYLMTPKSLRINAVRLTVFETAAEAAGVAHAEKVRRLARRSTE